jgi:hypothetical protein
MSEKTDGRLIADVISKVTKKKKFGEVEYRILKAFSNYKKAKKEKERLIKWSHQQSSPPLSRRIQPVIYDTTWKGKRYKLYVPTKWFVHNVQSC